MEKDQLDPKISVLEEKINTKLGEFDKRLKSVNERIWFILISILTGFGMLLLALLAIIVPLLNQLLKA